MTFLCRFEIGTNELRILNEKYEQVAVHRQKFGHNIGPLIDFENYISMLSRKPRAFLNSPYFPTLTEPVQRHLKSFVYADLKKILLTLVPIIREEKNGDAATILEFSKIRSTDDFAIVYRVQTENTRATESVITPITPIQLPYLPKLYPYTALLREGD
ncbi:hypothetical protein FACS1894219_12110 [Clostridia bacterium]|nr:hypothetical protein FACS1894219_12110 [Clostridia bacterium]